MTLCSSAGTGETASVRSRAADSRLAICSRRNSAIRLANARTSGRVSREAASSAAWACRTAALCAAAERSRRPEPVGTALPAARAEPPPERSSLLLPRPRRPGKAGPTHPARKYPGTSLPSRDPGHVRQLVGDALVTVDAGLFAAEEGALVRLGRARVLLRQVH